MKHFSVAFRNLTTFKECAIVVEAVNAAMAVFDPQCMGNTLEVITSVTEVEWHPDELDLVREKRVAADFERQYSNHLKVR